MATAGVHVRSSVHVTARSYTYLANEINRVFLETIIGVGLDPGAYAENQAVVEKGLRTWITLRQLDGAYLEIYDPYTDELRCRIDLHLEYRDSAVETYKTDIERVKGAIDRQYPGCVYRVVVQTKEGAARVSGWSDTEMRDTSHLSQTTYGSVIETAGGNINMAKWG